MLKLNWEVKMYLILSWKNNLKALEGGFFLCEKGDFLVKMSQFFYFSVETVRQTFYWILSIELLKEAKYL